MTPATETPGAARPSAPGVAGILAAAGGLAWLPWEALAGAGAVAVAVCIVVAPLAGLAIAALGVPFGGLAAIPLGNSRLTIVPVALALAAAGWILAALAGRRVPVVPTSCRGVLIALALFELCLLASAWAAPDAADAAVELARWGQLGLAVLLAAACAPSRRAGGLLLGTLLAAATVEALWGASLALRGLGPEAFALPGGRTRAFGSFGQPNPFAAYMNMAWPFGAALALAAVAPTACVHHDARRSGGSWSWLGFAGLASAAACGGALVLSWSRGGWLAAACAAGAMGAVWLASAVGDRRARARAAGLVWLAAVASGVLVVTHAVRVPGGVAARLGSIGATFVVWDVGDAEVDDANFATVERVAHWQAAAAMWADAPWLGQGPGRWEAAYPRFRLPRWGDPLGHAHNIYLHLLAETGLVGLAGYLVFFGALTGFALRAALRPRSARQAPLGLGLVGVLAALAFHGLLDNLYVHDLAVHLGLLVGLTAAAGESA